MKLIYNNSATPLVLNESADSTPEAKKYIFQGVFTACSTPEHKVINRNNRWYPEVEVCRHLTYLRENIQRDGCILGELDHPEGRFDVQLKEASHKITDLWYDQGTHCVMGKLELLDTPNGQIAQELVEKKFPLFVSSRAAGSVDPKTHEVSIDQIFTYDIVCTPGFAEARLERVNESLNENTRQFINESISRSKNIECSNATIDGLTICESSKPISLNERSMALKNKVVNMDIITKPLNEDEEEKDEFKLPQADVTLDGDGEKGDKEEKKENTEKSDENNTSLSDEEKKKNREDIISVESVLNGEEDELSDSEKEDNRADIVSVEASTTEKESDEENTEKSDEKSDEKSSTEDTEKTDDVAETTKGKVEKSEELSAETASNVDKYKKLLANLKSKNECKESIYRNYPFSIVLSPENFGKFAALKPTDKKKCMKYIVEHAIFDQNAINEQWDTALNEERKMMKNWLKLADKSDVELFTRLSLSEQDAIENMASFCLLETKEQVDKFWQNTGIRQRFARQQANEDFVRKYNVNVKPMNESATANKNPLGYSMDYIKMLEDLY